ncbi:MAG: LysM peptidoglycan-binding domain-containing M23 family metallopeptidase [Xanthobacteraceae bacterium]
MFGSDSASRNEATGSIPQGGNRVESRPLPHLASNAGEGVSGGGRGMGSYQPGNSEVTGSLPPAAPPPPVWTWEGGTPITVAPGENLETLSRRYGVPVAAIMEANSITAPAVVRPGQHLVIPRRRGLAAAPAAPQTRLATTAATVPSTAPVGPPRTALAPTTSVHVVAPGETLHSIARLYGKPVLALAKANNIPPDTMVKIGERIVIPDVRAASAPTPPAPVGPRAEAPAAAAAAPAGPNLATAESPHSARLATPVAPSGQESAVKTAEPAGALPSFRWPVRGRVIAGFGPKPNGLQNDGINLAVPEGTPVKAAEDGVVAYAGNELKGYGNLVLVRHSNGFVTAYAHASEILVKRGDTVKRGQVIAKSGQTGNVTAPQLHFEIRKGATPVDPSQYLNGA